MIRVLGLHGFRTNGRVLQRQAAKLQAACSELKGGTEFEFTMLDGPTPAAGDIDPAVSSLFPDEEMFYEWWNSVEDESGQKHYKGSTQTLSSLREYLRHEPAFDVYMGFSQGACLATVLAADALARRSTKAPSLVLLFCGLAPALGAIPGAAAWLPTVDAPMALPSVHVLGKEDKIYDRGVQLTQHFQEHGRHVLVHEGGHRLPRDAETNKAIAELLVQGLT